MVTPMKSLYSRPNCTPQERVELEKCHISHGKVSTWSTSLRDGMTQGSPPNKATAMSEVPQPTPHSPRCLSVILRGLPQFLWVSPHFLEIFLICLEVFSNFWRSSPHFFSCFGGPPPEPSSGSAAVHPPPVVPGQSAPGGGVAAPDGSYSWHILVILRV